MYGKIFESLYEGSMVGSGAIMFAVWGYVIAHMKPDKEVGAQVDLNHRLLGFVLGEKEADISEAIEKLCSPDHESRSPDEEGRRLVKTGQFSYRVVNGAKYMEIRSAEERREYFREAKRRSRSGMTGDGELTPGERKKRIQKKIALETKAGEEVREIFNPGYKPKPKPDNGNLVGCEILNKAVREDPITKQDRETMRKKFGVNREPTTTEREYDLDNQETETTSETTAPETED